MFCEWSLLATSNDPGVLLRVGIIALAVFFAGAIVLSMLGAWTHSGRESDGSCDRPEEGSASADREL